LRNGMRLLRLGGLGRRDIGKDGPVTEVERRILNGELDFVSRFELDQTHVFVDPIQDLQFAL
jgi:hypothetical protein